VTAPLTPAACDLTDYPSMLLDVARLRRSKAWLKCKRTPMLAFYMLNLWTASWHDKPAASLEDDDDVLADLAMCDPSKWEKVRKDALHGWVMCTDGRLYHPVVAEKALECWLDKLARTLSSGAGNAKRWKTPFDPKPIEDQMRVAKELLTTLNPNSKALHKRKTSGVPFQPEPDPAGIPDDIPPGSQEKVNGMEGEDEGKSSSEAKASAAADASPAVDKSTEQPTAGNAARDWLVSHGVEKGEARAFLNVLAHDFGTAIATAACTEAVAKAPIGEAKAFLGGIARRLANPVTPTVPSAEADKTTAYLERQAAERAPPPGAKVPDSVREARAKLGRVPATATDEADERHCA
jgi:hypothetical protein